MNMLPLLVIGAAIVAFFQDEFASFFRKLFSHAWVRVLLPLTLASLGVWSYTSMHWILDIMQARMHALMLSFFNVFPFGVLSAIVSQSLFLFLVSSVPVWGLYGWLKRKESEQITLKVTSTYLFVWLFMVLLWVV